MVVDSFVFLIQVTGDGVKSISSESGHEFVNSGRLVHESYEILCGGANFNLTT